MINRRIRVVLALVLVATGCKSATTSATTPTTSAMTSRTAPTSPTTSTSLPRTSPSSSTPTSAAPTTSTIAPLVAAEAEVRTAVAAFEHARAECVRTLPHCDVALFDEVMRGASVDDYKKGWADANANGWAVRHVERRRFVVVKVEFPAPTAAVIDRSVVAECVADSSVTVKPAAAPDGTDVIIDETSSTRQRSTSITGATMGDGAPTNSATKRPRSEATHAHPRDHPDCRCGSRRSRCGRRPRVQRALVCWRSWSTSRLGGSCADVLPAGAAGDDFGGYAGVRSPLPPGVDHDRPLPVATDR